MIKEFQSPYGNKIILVGTAHVSKKSVDEVVSAIRDFKPMIVAIEACEERYDVENKSFVIHEESLISHLRKGEPCYILGYGISEMELQLSRLLDIQLGGEMDAAVKEGDLIGAKIILIDQDINETLKNVWDNFSLLSKISEPIKYFGVAAFLKFLNLINVKVKIDFDEIISKANLNPEIFESSMDKSVVEDRNKILAENIFKHSSEGTVLAVLGGGHLPGVSTILTELNPSLVEIEQPKEEQIQVINYDHICTQCKKGFDTQYKGIINRQVSHCECGATYYHVSVNAFLLKFCCELKPNNEKDVKFLKFVYGSKLHEQ